MPSYQNKTNGVIVAVPEGAKMISVWELVTDEVTAKAVTPDVTLIESEIEASVELQTFDTVPDLKKFADKTALAKTARGSVYKYNGSEWRKVEA
jgi:hypothetical protein